MPTQTITQRFSPNHLAIIPDGNRRWAKRHAISNPANMYRKGRDNAFAIVETAFRLGIDYVTFWGSSYTNLAQRQKLQVGAMEAMYVEEFVKLAELPLLHEHKINVVVCGERYTLLEPKTNTAIQKAIDATANYNEGRVLTILVGYDGQRERGAAVLKLLQEHATGNIDLPNTKAEADRLLRDQSWTNHLPDVDLLIRTGAWEDPHNSAAFLSLATPETQYAFPQVLWPDFTPELLSQIVEDFTNRERRMGR